MSVKPKYLNVPQVEEIVKPIAEKYAKELEPRVEGHVSKAFIAKYLIKNFSREYALNMEGDPVNLAYNSSVWFFEILLEYGLNISWNGHHRAQSWAAYFKELSFLRDAKI